MTSAVDANALLEIGKDTPEALRTTDLLTSLGDAGPLIICEVAYAEVASALIGIDNPALTLFRDLDITLVPSTPEVLVRAGAAWRQYTQRRPRDLVCPECGVSQAVLCSACNAPVRTRQHLVADFLIGAHALILADRLVNRDRGFYATYFPELQLA